MVQYQKKFGFPFMRPGGSTGEIPMYEFPNQRINEYSDFVTGFHPGNVPSGDVHNKIIYSAT